MEHLFRTVLDILSEVLEGLEVEAMVLHTNPYAETTYLLAGTHKLMQPHAIKAARRIIPPKYLDTPLQLETVKHLFQYDEEVQKTVDFTIWTPEWVIRHEWAGAGRGTAGAKFVRVLKVRRNVSSENPRLEGFREFASFPEELLEKYGSPRHLLEVIPMGE